MKCVRATGRKRAKDSIGAIDCGLPFLLADDPKRGPYILTDLETRTDGLTIVHLPTGEARRVTIQTRIIRIDGTFEYRERACN